MPSRNTPAEPQVVRDAFSSFEDSLRAMLTTEAQRSVEEALERLSSESSAFHITDISVDVRIDRLNVATGSDGRRTAKVRPKAKARSAPTPSRPRRRARPGGLRETLMGAFSGAGQELTTEDFRRHLDAQGVEATTGNIHQHLGRLVKAGELSRPRHGVYRQTGS